MYRFQRIAKLIGIKEIGFDEIELTLRATVNQEEDIIIRVPKSQRYDYGSYYVITQMNEIIGEVYYFD